VEYRVLGPLEARDGDGPIPLGGEKQRALLALLLINPNRVVARARLVDELWGDDPPPTAVGTVQVYVSRLRKILPKGALETRPPGYRLSVEPGALDVARFEQLLSSARGADARDAAALLREALSLWRGPPFAELADEPFARAERGRLEDVRLAALEDRIAADLALGGHADVVGDLERLIAEHPHRERPRGQLIVALYRSGRQAEALDAYRAARAALDELGLEPSAALRTLERQVLAQDPALDAPGSRPLPDGAVPLPAPLVPSSPFPLVGRSDDLARLNALLKRAADGEGAFVLLTGEPGAGKTRLIRELAHGAAGEGVLVCYGASDATVTIPYQPLRDWLEFLLRVCDRDALAACAGDGCDVLARLAPAFGQVAGDDEPIDRYTLQTTVADFLRRLGDLRPLVLVAEDIHWADAESLALLARLARTVPAARVLVVASFRKPGEEIQPELAGTLADLLRLDGVERLAVGSLRTDDLGTFVRDVTAAPASAELVAAIEELTDGNALLVCELWRELVSTGAVDVSGSEVTLARPLGDIGGPESIGELVEHRLSRLSPSTGAMIELAAVTGPRFELGVVADAAGLDHAALTTAVEQAVRSGIIEELPAGPAGRFTHELVRRGVYDRISGVRRAELHLRVGEALERGHAADPSGVLPELAHHFTLAAPVAGAQRAVDYNLRAADAAMASVAYTEAAAALSTALEFGIADPRERIRVQGELGNLYYETGRIAEADAILTASLDGATTLEERGLATRALVQLSNPRLASDPRVSSAEIVPIAQDAIKTFEQLGDTRGLAMAEHLLGHALSREGRTAEAYVALDQALGHAEAAGDQVMGRHIIGRTAVQACSWDTPAGEAIVRVERLRSSSLNNPVLDAGLRAQLASLLSMAGRFDEALPHIEASDRVRAEAVETDFLMQSMLAVAEAFEFAGDFAAAEERYTEAFLHMRDARGDEFDSRAMRYAAGLALLLADQGRWDEAADYLTYGADVDGAMPVQGKAYSFLRFAAKGRLAAQEGNCATALDLVQRAVEVAGRSAWVNSIARVWLARAEVERACGHADKADAAVVEALRLYEKKGNVAVAARVRDALTDLATEA